MEIFEVFEEWLYMKLKNRKLLVLIKVYWHKVFLQSQVTQGDKDVKYWQCYVFVGEDEIVFKGKLSAFCNIMPLSKAGPKV